MSWGVKKVQSENETEFGGVFNSSENSEIDVYVLEQEGDTLGAMYVEKDDLNSLKYIEIVNEYRGQTIGNKSLARILSEEVITELEDDLPVKTESNAMNGKIQHLRQGQGFETSGFVLDGKQTYPNQESNVVVTTELWMMDEEVEAYLPKELRNFTEASLQSQRNIEYSKPDEQDFRYSLDISDSIDKTGSKVLQASINEGEETLDEIISEIENHENSSRYWGHEVKMDSANPSSFKAAQRLWENGYRPINLSPKEEGQELSMAQINTPLGQYNLTPGTMDVLEASGLNYEVNKRGELSDTVTLVPDDYEPNLDIDEATEEELAEFAEKIGYRE